MIEEFITIEHLRELPVLVALVWMLTRYIFGPLIDFITHSYNTHIHTRYIVYIIALALLFIPDILESNLIASVIILNIINAVIVSWAAMKAHESFAQKKK